MAKKDKNDKSTKKTGRVYKRNYLTQVLARLDFSTAHNILEGGPPKKVAKALRASFPIIEQKKQFELQAQVQLVSPEKPKKRKGVANNLQQSQREFYQWFFHSKDRTKNFH